MTAAWVPEKNKVSQFTAWLYLMKITIPAVSPVVLRYARNNEDVTWGGYSWLSNNFRIGEINDDDGGEVQAVTISIQNIDRVMENYLQAYDTYCKANGFSPVMIELNKVNSGYLSEANPAAFYGFMLLSYAADAYSIEMYCGQNNPFRLRFPEYRLIKNYCQFKFFAGAECGYSGAETECDRTLTRCRELGNSARFGGFPGVGDGAIKWR